MEEKPYGPRLVVSVGVVNCCGHKSEVQRFHRRRGPLSAGVRLNLGRERTPLIRLLLAACGPPAEQQDEPPCPQHGSESPVFTINKENKKKVPTPSMERWGGEEGWGGRTPGSLGDLVSRSPPQSTEGQPPPVPSTLGALAALRNRFLSLQTHDGHLSGHLPTPSLSPADPLNLACTSGPRMRAPAKTSESARPRMPITCRGFSLSLSQGLSLLKHVNKFKKNKSGVKMIWSLFFQIFWPILLVQLQHQRAIANI